MGPYKIYTSFFFIFQKLCFVILGLSDNEQLRKDILMGQEKSKEARVVQAGRRLSFKEAQKLDSDNEQMPSSDMESTRSSVTSQTGATKRKRAKKKGKNSRKNSRRSSNAT